MGLRNLVGLARRVDNSAHVYALVCPLFLIVKPLVADPSENGWVARPKADISELASIKLRRMLGYV